MRYQTTIIAALVVMVTLSMAFVIGVLLTGSIDATSTPLIVTILTEVATVVASLLALLRVDRVSEKQDVINGDVVKLKEQHSDNSTTPNSGGV